MSNATVRANAIALPNRRNMLTTATVAAASAFVLAPTAALAGDRVDDPAYALWEERAALREPIYEALRADAAALAAMPAWAAPGGRDLFSDGSYGGPVTAYPAARATPEKGRYFAVRFGPEDIARRRTQNARWMDPNRAELIYQIEKEEVEALLDAWKREQERVGFPAARAHVERLVDRMYDIERDIRDLAPTAPVVAATLALNAIADLDPDCAVGQADDLDRCERALTYLRPLLTGALARDIGEILDNPERPIGACRAYIAGSVEDIREIEPAESTPEKGTPA